jgi:DNA-binding transcriptional MerR regulator
MEKKTYTTGEVSKMTGVPTKTLERWTNSKSVHTLDKRDPDYKKSVEKINQDKNQDLFQVARSTKGYRVFTRKDIEKILLINLHRNFGLYRDFGVKYEEIRLILEKHDSFKNKLASHTGKLKEDVEKLNIMQYYINLINYQTDDDNRFEIVKILSIILSDKEVKDIIQMLIDYLKNKVEKIVFSNDDKNKEKGFQVAKSHLISQLDKIIDNNVISRLLVVKEVEKGTKDKNDDAPFNAWSLFANGMVKLTDDNTFVIDILLSGDGDILHEIWSNSNQIDTIGFVSEENIRKSLTEHIKSLIKIPYLSVHEQVDGYYLVHQLYKNKDIQNLKRLINLGKTDINLKDNFHLTLLDYAANDNDIQMMKYLLSQGARLTSNVLMSNKDMTFIKTIIDHFSDPTVRYFLNSAFEGDLESVKFLLEYKYGKIKDHFIEKYIQKSEKYSEYSWNYPSFEFIFLIASHSEHKYKFMNCFADKLSAEYRKHILKILIKYDEMNYLTEYLRAYYPDSNQDLTEILEYLIDCERDPVSVKYILDNYKISTNDYLHSRFSHYTDQKLINEGNDFYNGELLSNSLAQNPEYVCRIIDLILPKIDKEKYKSENCVNLLASLYEIQTKTELNEHHFAILNKFINYFFNGDKGKVIHVYIDAILGTISVDPPMPKEELIESLKNENHRLGKEIEFAEGLIQII